MQEEPVLVDTNTLIGWIVGVVIYLILLVFIWINQPVYISLFSTMIFLNFQFTMLAFLQLCKTFVKVVTELDK